MDAEGLKELFEPVGPVSLKRMFSGHGVYSDGLCFALALRGEIYLKSDDEAEPAYVAVGSAPFVYEKRGKPVTVGYWRLTPEAYDDADELKRLCGIAMSAARRFAAAKAGKAALASSRRRKPAARKR